MNKAIWLPALVVTVSMTACNGGAAAGCNTTFNSVCHMTTTVPPVDQQSGTYSNTEDPNNTEQVAFVANNCRTIPESGTCNVSLIYSATGIYEGESVGFGGLESGSYTSNIATCSLAESVANTCAVTITNTGGSVNNVDNVFITLNNIANTLHFSVGGGL